MAALADPEPTVRWAAGEALGNINSRLRPLPWLVQALVFAGAA